MPIKHNEQNMALYYTTETKMSFSVLMKFSIIGCIEIFITDYTESC